MFKLIAKILFLVLYRFCPARLRHISTPSKFQRYFEFDCRKFSFRVSRICKRFPYEFDRYLLSISYTTQSFEFNRNGKDYLWTTDDPFKIESFHPIPF